MRTVVLQKFTDGDVSCTIDGTLHDDFPSQEDAQTWLIAHNAERVQTGKPYIKSGKHDVVSGTWQYAETEENEQPQTFTLTWRDTPGCYAHDDDGNPWATFEAVNHTVPCGVCGHTITGGWARGMLGDETYFCSEHIRTIYAERWIGKFPILAQHYGNAIRHHGDKVRIYWKNGDPVTTCNTLDDALTVIDQKESEA